MWRFNRSGAEMQRNSPQICTDENSRITQMRTAKKKTLRLKGCFDFARQVGDF
jgi:hypothetical protein